MDCREGKGKPLKSGSTLPVSRTSSTIPVDLVNNVLRLPYRERLRLIIGELGTGLAGRPQDLAEVLRRAHPGLRETSRTLNILAGQRQVINQFIGDAATTVAELDARKADVSRWVTEAGDAAEIAASRREDLRRNFELLPTTLARLRPYMVQLRKLADDQIPTLRDLRAGPHPTSTGPWRGWGRSATPPAPPSAPWAAPRSRARPPCARPARRWPRSRKLGKDVPGFSKPLRQFLQTMDDAQRSVERDPRAAASAPPAPDKTADRTSAGRDGFTGFEAFWNYAYWQALAINGRDSKSHILRINAFPGPCADYRATDELAEAVFQECKQNLGPSQPGIGGQPDPTAGGAGASRSRDTRATSARNRRTAGDARDAKKEALDEKSADKPAGPTNSGRCAEALGRRARQAAGRCPRRPSLDPGHAQDRVPSDAHPLVGRKRRDAPRLPPQAMSRRRQAAGAIVASPVLVGAVTVLVAIVAVFIAYGANSGLPFVPTYDLKVELPSGAKLVKGNEVRVGGFRVGVVEQIGATRVATSTSGDQETVAVTDLKLDKTVEPLAKDTSFTVRPRSALGLKYIEVVPGKSKQTFAAGSTVKLGNGGVDSEPPLELEDVLSTFDAKTREASRTGLEGFGSGLAGRGQSINEAIREFNPLLRSLTPVMRNLSDPDTELAGFFQGLGRAAAETAPVASTNAALFGNMADTFAAITRSPAALQDSISEGVPTQIQSIHSFRFQLPFLRDFADLSRRLRPAARQLPRSLPQINRALLVGTDVLPRTVEFSNGLRNVFNELDNLGENPNTLLAINDLDLLVRAGKPGLDFVGPYQTVCNYAVYFLNPLGTHISDAVGGGTLQRVQLKFANPEQQNALNVRGASRPVDVRAGQDNKQPGPNPPATLHGNPDAPAIDANGNADCEAGQTGYVDRFFPDGRYGPNELGGRKVALGSDLPGLRGGTYKSRQLGIDNLSDVP